MLLADRPTTTRWAPPPTGANTPYQARPILEGKNRGRHFVRKTPLSRGKLDRNGARPRFSLRPYANRRPRGHRKFNTGIAMSTIGWPHRADSPAVRVGAANLEIGEVQGRAAGEPCSLAMRRPRRPSRVLMHYGRFASGTRRNSFLRRCCCIPIGLRRRGQTSRLIGGSTPGFGDTWRSQCRECLAGAVAPLISPRNR